ncbi:hypothetical protein DA100_13590 [Vibrio sp. Hep-1b-8]|nr:hypothetical protein DA100_13590 [Vibrio sp. Hep-1b-8]
MSCRQHDAEGGELAQKATFEAKMTQTKDWQGLKETLLTILLVTKLIELPLLRDLIASAVTHSTGDEFSGWFVTF